MKQNRQIILGLALITAMAAGAQSATTPEGQQEKLSRGLVVVPAQTSSYNFLSWRLLGTDDENTAFDILRGGTTIATNKTATYYIDKAGTTLSEYQIVTKQSGVATDTSAVATRWSSICYEMPVSRPEGGTLSGTEYGYSPNDCSVGDVDGDGDYEIILKWDPSNSKDNSFSGYTGNVYLDCYKLDGTQLWRIDLGVNIRAGAHYTQFLVYDFDKDGKAEVICKTAPGSIDGQGNYVNQAATDSDILSADNTADHRNSGGRINGGQEYLTVFDGETGAALHTVFYNPNRNGGLGGDAAGTLNWYNSSSKSDTGSYGNRGERYLAAVAYLDGPDELPYAIMGRGYYTFAYVWAVGFDGTELSTKWLHASLSTTRVTVTDADGNSTSTTYSSNTSGNSGSNTLYANGNHNLSIADVDGDGKDEIIYGSGALDDDGTLLYATGYGHGDAIHVSDLVPSREGYEVFQVHEESSYGWDLHDAATGEILLSSTGDSDNGRGLSADIEDGNEGFEFWSANDRQIRSATTGEVVSTSSVTVNFRTYWDGDLQDELFDSGKMDKWNGSGTTRIYPISGSNFYDLANSSTCNSSKATPNLQADFIGDWREEIILWNNSDSAHINIFTTNEETSYRVPTLMHDHVYRMGIAWQNTAYNQPPHLGYYLPSIFATKYGKIQGGDFEQTVVLGDSIETIQRNWQNCANPSLVSSTDPLGNEYSASVPSCFTWKLDRLLTKTFTLSGLPTYEGVYEIVIKSGANVVDSSIQYDTIRITVTSGASGIDNVLYASGTDEIFNIAGSLTDQLTLNLGQGATRKAKVVISDTAGRIVYARTYEDAGSSLTIDNLGRLTQGIYIVNVDTEQGSQSLKVKKEY